MKTIRLPLLAHDRRHLLHFNATYNPTAAWAIQKLREAFPYDAPKYLIPEGDAIFSPGVMRFIKAMVTTPRRIAYRSPWENPVAERWIGRADHGDAREGRRPLRARIGAMPRQAWRRHEA